jgi:hypothetical protein
MHTETDNSDTPKRVAEEPNISAEELKFADMEVPADAGPHREALVAILSRIPPHMGQWIDCEAGWFPLLAELHEDLLGLDPNHVVMQVKEKYATLRYDAVCSSDDPLVQEQFLALLDIAERVSQTICEVCSSPARLSVSVHPYPLYKTICAACAAKIAAASGRVYRPYIARPRRDARW